MALVLSAVLVLPALYAAGQTWFAIGAEEQRRYELLESTSRLISAYQSDFVERTWTILAELANREVVREAGPDCGAALLSEVRQSQVYGNFAVVDASRRILCASNPKLVGTALSEPVTFNDDVRRGPVVSEVVESRDGVSGRTVIAAAPLPPVAGPASDVADSGRSPGRPAAIEATLLLPRFTALPNIVPLPQGAVAYVVDRSGTPLQFAAGPLITLPKAEENRLVLRDDGPRTWRDGPRRWLLLAAPIARGQLAVITGVPIDPWGWLRRGLVWGIIVPTTMLALAGLAVWLAVSRLVSRHIVALAAVASEYGSGRMRPEPPTRHAPAEIKALSTALADMAIRVHARESELEASLAQKDALLREIHHRIKNNLQIVTSLLNLRAQRLVSPVARGALNEAQTRIKALALVHRHLYEQQEVKAVELHGFLDELATLLADTTGAGGDVHVVVDVAPTTVTPDQAIPLALLVTEGLSNALKHAFPQGRPGRVDLRLRHEGEDAVLEIADNGVGYEDGDGGGWVSGEGGLGLTLIRMLARQIGGTVELTTGPDGTCLRLPFRRPES